MIDADKLRDASPWQPIDSPLDVAFLGKLLEELGECISAVSRCLIQGINEAEPVTGKLNRRWLEDEIADITACIALVADRYNLDTSRVASRVVRKVEHLEQWHSALRYPES